MAPGADGHDQRKGNSGAQTDARLQAAELMSRRLAAHPGATPGTRRIAEDFVSALRQVVEEARAIQEARSAAASGPDHETRARGYDPLDDLDARASDLLSALAAVHAVIVRRDPSDAARTLVEAERTLSSVRALETGTQEAHPEEK